jgi:(p)ppGpp synthase/HD superfamily hydrolase
MESAMITEFHPYVRKAGEFASHAHRGQTRKDGVTHYITHPARVASAVKRHILSLDVQAACWMHDVVEDTAYTLTDLRMHEFTPRTIVLVHLMSKLPGGKASKSRYYDAILSDPDALLIKLLDRTDNLSEANVVGIKDKSFAPWYARKTRAEIAPLADACAHTAIHDEFFMALVKLEREIEAIV